MTIYRAILCLAFPFLLATTQAASADVFDGYASVDAQIDREHADVTITGQAAYAIFWVTAYRMRLEEVAVGVQRARGNDVTCYAQGAPIVPIEEWSYSCYLVVGEFGGITAPPIPAYIPQPGDLL